MVIVKFNPFLPDGVAPLPPNWAHGEVQMPAAPRVGESVHGPNGGMWLVQSVDWEQYKDGTWIAQVTVR